MNKNFHNVAAAVIALCAITAAAPLCPYAEAAGGVLPETSPAVAPVASMKVEVPAVVPVASFINARVTLKNISDKGLLLPTTLPLVDYKVVVKNSSGVTTPLTEYGESKTVSVAVYRSLDTGLSPGQSEVVDLPLNRIFDMTKTGKYFVSVTRRAFTPIGKQWTTITSDAVPIEVVNPVEGKSVVEQDTAPVAGVLPSTSWKTGDTWKAIVEVFRSSSQMAANQPVSLSFGSGPVPNNPIIVIDTYPMTIKVVNIQKTQAGDQATMQFIPSGNAPSYVQGRNVQVVVDRQTNQLLEVKSQNLKPGDVVEKLDGKPILVRPINGYAAGFPCDIIPTSSLLGTESSTLLTSLDGAMSLSVSKVDGDNYKLWSEKLTVKDRNWFRVTQKWPNGQKWWSQYVKEDFDSQIGMRATTIGSSDLIFGTPMDGLQLGLASEDALAAGGEAVHLRVALRNTSDKDVTLIPVLMGNNLNLTVTDAAQRAVPLTVAGKEALAKPPLLFDTQILPAHSTIYRDLLLNKKL